MKHLVVLSLIFLAGCSTTVPVKINFPPVPEELTKSCPDLDKVEPGTKELSKTLEVVVKNYSKYHECRIKVDAWNEWYKDNKEIFESLNK
jgi:hypothetical protein